MSSSIVDDFFRQYKYYPQRLWKEWLGPKQLMLEGTVLENHVPPLLQQQRQQMTKKLEKDVVDDRFLFFLRILLGKVLDNLEFERKMTMVPQESMFAYIFKTFPKSVFRQRVNPRRSLFYPLPWKLLTKNMTPISCSFSNVPILLQGSMNSQQYNQLLQSYMVGSLVNRLRYRIPFFLYTYTLLDVIPNETKPLTNNKNKIEEETSSSTENVLLLMTESPVSFSEESEPYLSLQQFLRQVDITMADFFHIFIQILVLLHHLQFYLGITIHNLSLERIVVRPTPSSFPPVFSFDVYGREFQLQRGNFMIQYRGWSDANFRDHSNILYDMNMTYYGSEEGKRSRFSASTDMFQFLLQVREICIEVLSPSMKTSNTTTWEFKLHVEAILKFIHILWAQFYEFPIDSIYWLEKIPKGISVYESLACSKTPASVLDFLLLHQNVWKGDLGLASFPLSVLIRETLLPSTITSTMSTRLPHVLEDFVGHDFYSMYDESYRPLGWFSTLSAIPSLDSLEVEMNELSDIYGTHTLAEFEFKALVGRNGQVMVDAFSFYEKTYLRPSSPFYGKVKGTYAFVNRLNMWMENMYFLQAYRYDDFAKFQKRNRKGYSLLVKIYADPKQMLFFEQVLSYLEMLRVWIDKYTIIKTTQTVIRSPFQQQQQQQKQQKQQKQKRWQQQDSRISNYTQGPRFLPPNTSYQQQQSLPVSQSLSTSVQPLSPPVQSLSPPVQSLSPPVQSLSPPVQSQSIPFTVQSIPFPRQQRKQQTKQTTSSQQQRTSVPMVTPYGQIYAPPPVQQSSFIYTPPSL